MSVYIGSYNKKNMKKHVAETDTSDNRKGNATPAASNGGISIANGAAVKKRATYATDVGASFIDRRTNPYADAIKKYDEQKATKQTYTGDSVLGQKTPFVTAQTVKKESDPLYKATTQKKKEKGGVGGRLVRYPTNETLTFSEFKDRYGEKNADVNYNDYLSNLSTPMLEAVQRKNENTGDANNVARSAAGKVVRHITDFITGNGESQNRYEESANKIDNYLSARKNQEALESIDADTEKLLSAYFNEESKDDPTNQFALGLIEGEGYTYKEQKNRSLMEEIRNAVAEKGLDFDTVYSAYSAERNAGRRKNIEDQNKALAEEHPVLSSLYQPFVGVAGGIASLSRGMSDFTGYQGADNSFRFTDAANAQRQVVSENVSNELYKRTGSKTIADIGGFAYGIGESLLQSGIAFGVTAATGMSSLGSSLLGLSAGADTYRSALDKGIDEDSAALTGMAAGTAETLFEAVSLSIALEQFMTPGMSLFDFVKNIVLQGIGEASEEGATDIANYATDYLINGELSEIKQRIDYYKSKGATPEEAARLTAKDFAKQTGEDMLAGFISGGISSTAEQGAGAAIRKVTAPNAYVRGEKIKYDRAGSKNNTVEVNAANQNVDIIDENGNIVNFTEPDNTNEATDTAASTLLLEAAREAAQREAQKNGAEKTVEYVPETPVKSEDSTETIQSEEAAETPVHEAKTEEKNTSDEPSARKIASVNRIKGEAVITVELSDGRKVTSDKANYADDEQKTLFEGLAKNKDYSVTDINTLIKIKDTVPEMDAETFVSAANEGYGYGAGGLKREYIRADAAFNELPEATKELIYDLGANARTSRDTARAESIRKSAKGTTGSWRGGTVKARDKSVTIDSLKKTFNDAQNIAYKVLSFYADATGIDIDLYASQPNEAGEYTETQGEYNRSTRRIAIDINAGLRYGKDVNSLGKYTALRTFGHEIVHFSKDFAPEETSELESAVFDYLESKGTSTADLIDDLMMKDNRLSYTDASQEVVAEGLTDALGESDFVENLCKEHRSLAQKIVDKLKEFIAMLKNAWAKLNKSSYAATKVLKEEVDGEIRYAESILKKYDAALKTAVENYQRTFTDEVDPTQKIKKTQVTTDTKERIDENAEIRESGGREQEDRSDNGGAVLQPAHNRAGASRLLDEQQAADVQGTGEERNAVDTVAEGERQTGRNDNGADTADRTGGRTGNSEERDLRRDAELNEEAAELPEVVEKEISQKSTEEPKGSNFVIGDSLDLPSGEKARFRTNVDAIRLIAKLEAENRFATAEEQTALSKYVGWGGLSNAFGEMVFNRESRKNEMRAKSGWENEFNELRSLVDEGIITEDEYKAMSASTVNAHYTSIDVIKGMYTGLKMLGYAGGRMLEPSSGVGNFVGAMPSEMTAGVKSWTMVELDRVTGLIAKYLYPHSDVRIEGFQDTLLPDNYIDVAIGNVPFGNANFADRKYPSSITKVLHNYFFAKSLDVVRPGGLVMFITSSFTMNAENAAVRQYLANRADLIGAIRLPNNAFKGNAGTEVVTDILVFKKRKPNTQYTGDAFINSPRVQIGEGYYQAANINEYFNTHPEMVLGTPEIGRGMYGSNSLTYNALEGKGTLREQIENAFKNISARMEYPAAPVKENVNAEVSRKRKSSKNGSFVVNADGTVSRNENGELKKIDADDKTVKRITGMVKIRDGYIDLTTALIQDFTDETVEAARKKLNAAYDSFVKAYGYINSRANVKILEGSPDEYSLRALEKYDAKTKTAEKADIFTRNTISPNKTITHVDTIEDGISASINTKGAVDAAYIAEITGIPVEQATKEMLNARLVFKNTRGVLESREQYLSGNVRAKLREAKALVSIDGAYKLNVEELEKVVPEDISYDDIFVTPGSPWIPTDVYADFITHILGGYKHSYGTPDVEVERSAQTGEFKIQINNKRLLHGYNNTQEYGTSRKTFKDIIETLMDGRTVRVNDTIEDENGKKRPVLNKEETTAAQAKADKIAAEFRRWLWDDNERRAELSKLYNETFNAIVPPLYDGKNLTVNGLNADFSLREHQANVVQRIIMSGGNTLIAHKVGAGKSATRS